MDASPRANNNRVRQLARTQEDNYRTRYPAPVHERLATYGHHESYILTRLSRIAQNERYGVREDKILLQCLIRRRVGENNPDTEVTRKRSHPVDSEGPRLTNSKRDIRNVSNTLPSVGANVEGGYLKVNSADV